MTVEKYDASTKTATIQTRGENLRVEVYDERDRLLSVSLNGNIEQVYGYEGDNPHPVSYIADSQTLYYSYDEAYNLLSITYPDTTSQNYSYTKEGQLSSHNDALGNSTKYSYNEKAQLISIEEPNQSKSNFTYDALGRMLTQEDALGEKHSYSYNDKDQVQSYSDPEGNAIDFSYSKEGQLQSLTDPANRKTTYSYDAHERLIEKRYPNGSKESYTYQANAALQSIHRVDGTTVHFSYDSNENICQVIAKDSEGNEEVLEYDYDALSNLQSAKTKAHTIALQYNEKASITKETQNNLTLHKTYAQNQKQIQSLGFESNTQTQWIQYAYDGSQNISDITYQAKKIKLSYNANHLATKREYPNKQKEQMVYDESYNLTTLHSQNHIDYSYDATGRVVNKYNKTQQIESSYTYTPSGALSQATSTDSVNQFSYNKAGNQTHNEQQ
jgi:YD repeat-containing protein